MHKAQAYANDLADHDDIEDDCELVFGSHSNNINAVVPLIRYIGSSNSFKDTSILGSAPVAAKLAQALSAQCPSSLLLRTSTPHSGIYAGGNPVISTAPASRPSSGTERMPCTSVPSDAPPAPASNPVPMPKFTHGSSASGFEAQMHRSDTAEPRMIGYIQAGQQDSIPSQPKSGLLRRLSSLTSMSWPASAKHEAAGADPSSATSKPAKGAEGTGCQATAEPPFIAVVRSTAVPFVDVEPERRQLHRKLSLHDVPRPSCPRGVLLLDDSSATVARNASRRPSSCGSRGPSKGPEPHAQIAKSCSNPAEAQIAKSCSNPAEAQIAKSCSNPAEAQIAKSCSNPAEGQKSPLLPTDSQPERPLTPLRRLSRMLSNTLAPAVVGATAVSDQRDQDGAGASKRRTSISGMRGLFSRPSSAKNKSETGSAWVFQQQLQQLPMEAWKHTLQQRREPHVTGCDDGLEDDRVQEFMVGEVASRQASGILKRAAVALAAVVGR